jgi:hypothetical protein
VLKTSLSTVLAALLLLAVSSGNTAASGNLLTNPGFETGDTTGWSSVGGDLSRVPVSNTGEMGAQLTSDGQDTVAKMWQDVPVEAFAKYQLSGWSNLNDPSVDHVNLQIQWLDQAGGLIGTENSLPILYGVAEVGTYTYRVTGPLAAPSWGFRTCDASPPRLPILPLLDACRCHPRR